MKFTSKNGKHYCAKELAALQGVSYNTLIHRKRRGWSDDEIISGKRLKEPKGKLALYEKEIIMMRTAGDSLGVIGKRFGTDSGNISRFLKKIGFDDRLFKNHINSKTADKVSELRKQRISISGIAKNLGLSRSTVWHYVKRLKLQSFRKLKAVYSDAELESRRLKKNRKLTDWRRSNKDRVAKDIANRRASDVMFAIKSRVRATTTYAFKRRRWGKGTNTHELLGCSWPELKAWIESLFKPGMSWDNRGDWHIDHKIPLASAATVKELKALCHFTNLQPLWARENLSKGAKR